MVNKRDFALSSLCAVFVCSNPAATSIPQCYRAVMVHGFVEELVVNEDPEYQWIDRIRTPRASNEARQRLISLMSGKSRICVHKTVFAVL